MGDREVEEMLETVAMRQQVFSKIKDSQWRLAIMVSEAENTMKLGGESLLSREIHGVISELKNAVYILRQLEK
jgi:hypothetical protein